MLNDPEMCEMVGRSLGPSLQILHLGLGASEIEAKGEYIIQTRITKLRQDLQQKKHPNSLNYLTMRTNTSRKECDRI